MQVLQAAGNGLRCGGLPADLGLIGQRHIVASFPLSGTGMGDGGNGSGCSQQQCIGLITALSSRLDQQRRWRIDQHLLVAHQYTDTHAGLIANRKLAVRS
ncbi:hypothetical protein D3C78_1697340 [compost metagenome]